MLMVVSAFIAMRMLMIMTMTVIMSGVLVIGMRNRRIESVGETRPPDWFLIFLTGICFSPAFALQMKIRRRQQLA